MLCHCLSCPWCFDGLQCLKHQGQADREDPDKKKGMSSFEISGATCPVTQCHVPEVLSLQQQQQQQQWRRRQQRQRWLWELQTSHISKLSQNSCISTLKSSSTRPHIMLVHWQSQLSIRYQNNLAVVNACQLYVRFLCTKWQAVLENIMCYYLASRWGTVG